MTSPKILFLSYRFYPDVGGIETMSEILCDGFFNQGFVVKVVTTTATEGVESKPYAVIRNPSKAELVKLHKWADIIFENNPTLNLSWPNLLIKKPLIVCLHTWLARVDGSKGLQDKLKQWWLKRAGKVIACSHALAKATFPSAIVISNPYDDKLFKVLDKEQNRDKKYVFLGRLVSDKGVSLAIECFSQLRKSEFKDQNITLTIIGDGPERSDLETLVAGLNVKEDVIFTGKKQGAELVRLLNDHEVILIPSVWEEPFGLVALEGMACGCIPVASTGGGLPEAVGKGGLLFEKGNIDQFKAALLRLENEKVLKDKLRTEGQIHLRSHQRDYILTQYLKVVNETLNNG